jgi:hypothetical protein
MPKTDIKEGQSDHDRAMTLADFDHAEVRESYLYELSRDDGSVGRAARQTYCAITSLAAETGVRG